MLSNSSWRRKKVITETTQAYYHYFYYYYAASSTVIAATSCGIILANKIAEIIVADYYSRQAASYQHFNALGKQCES